MQHGERRPPFDVDLAMVVDPLTRAIGSKAGDLDLAGVDRVAVAVIEHHRHTLTALHAPDGRDPRRRVEGLPVRRLAHRGRFDQAAGMLAQLEHAAMHLKRISMWIGVS